MLDFLVPFTAIAVAEFGDKTQLSILLLSSQTKERLQLFIGLMLAFLVVDGIAVLAGSWATNIIPTHIVKIASALLFIVIGAMLFCGKIDEERTIPKFQCPFVSGFLLIFIAEWGDKTQMAAGIFATIYNPLLVLIGTLAALGLISLIALYFGGLVSHKIERRMLAKLSGIVFILIGLSAFLF
ncbi:MAG: TMEM165/GDT1 family protein [Candidatus Micrarchaeia archaeon]